MYHICQFGIVHVQYVVKGISVCYMWPACNILT
jgi:hypothetical protein